MGLPSSHREGLQEVVSLALNLCPHLRVLVTNSGVTGNALPWLFMEDLWHVTGA